MFWNLNPLNIWIPLDLIGQYRWGKKGTEINKYIFNWQELLTCFLERKNKKLLQSRRLSLGLATTRDLGWEVLFYWTQLSENSRHPSEKSITGFWPWVVFLFSPALNTKSDMLWPFARALAAGIWDSLAVFFFLFFPFPVWVHSCYKAAEIPSLSIKTRDKSGHL